MNNEVWTTYCIIISVSVPPPMTDAKPREVKTKVIVPAERLDDAVTDSDGSILLLKVCEGV